MTRNNGVRRGARPRRSNRNKNILLIILVVILGAAGLIFAKNKATEIAKERERLKIEQQKKAEIERLKKLPVIGASHEARKKYGVDAREVWKRLENMDYSNDGKKIVFLTFDDGPSVTVTPKILKILKDEGVHATFFLNAKQFRIEGAEKYTQQAFKEDNAIGNHTFSHDYHYLYPGRVLNLNHFLSDIKKNDEEFKRVLGKKFKTNVVRCPGGYMSWKNMEPLKQYLIKNKMSSIDWNALSGDAEAPKKNAQQLYDYAIKTSQGKDIVVLLMHDTYGKEDTAKALPGIIKYFKDNGYAFKILV